MAADSTPGRGGADSAADTFDVGPLSWVHGEIDQALTRGLDALATFKGAPKEAIALKHARTHIHQAAGAIQMVGLDAVVAYTDEIERQLTRLEELPVAQAPAAVDIVDRACRRLKIFLDELVNGAPPVPLKLFPEYEQMQAARGVKAVAPTDLFYPDLGARPPKVPAREALPVSRLQSLLVKQRRVYQRGLLAWLRGDADGITQMKGAIADIEEATTQAPLRAFWWTCGALFEALGAKGLEPSFGLKQLTARVDLQIRRVLGGSAKVADRLRREVLYYVAIAAPVGPQVQGVQKAFHLSGLIPSADALNADLVRLQPLLREAREQLAGAKDAWLKFASGRAENLPKLKATLTSVHTKAAEVRNGALMKLTSALVERLEKMPSSGVSESVAMEYATALLLAESAFDNYSNLGPDFPKQVDAMIARLDAARAGRGVPTSGAPALDEMSRRAQERMLLAQVGREIQANLRHMEQVLDAFFRDNSKRADLASLAKDSAQIRGALLMLGLNDAEKLLMSCQEQIDSYVGGEEPVDNDDLEMLAESLSGLGFYIEAVEQQRPDRERLIAPLLAKRSGETTVVEIDDDAKSVESAVAELRAQLPALLDELHAGGPRAASHAALKSKLEALRDDAELIGDATLVQQAASALAELDAGGAALAKAVDAIADTASAAAPEISDETKRLLETDATAFDGELLDIYLTEAHEVLDTIAAHHKLLAANPSDREALRTVRRGFHTLKGSGRMVGLTDLGELAFDVERVHNRLLEEDRPVTPAVLAMIAVAERDFRVWIGALQKTKRVTPDPAALHAAIDKVLAELPPGPGPASPPPPGKPRLVDIPEATGDALPARDSGPPPLALVDELDDLDALLDRDAREASGIDFVKPDVPAVAPAPAAREPAPAASDWELDVEPVAPPPPVVPPAAPAKAPGNTPSTIELPPLVDLPELGTSAGPAPQIIVRDAVAADEFAAAEDLTVGDDEPPPGLRLVADNDLEQIDLPSLDDGTAEPAPHDAAAPDAANEATPRALPLAAVLPFAPAAGAGGGDGEGPGDGATDDDVVIGDVRLSATLYRILADEADEHLATLHHELSLLQFEPQRLPSPAMVRASHTLCGIHRTGGFPVVAATAKSLELALSALAEHAPPLPSHAQPVLARAVAALDALVARIKQRAAFTAAEQQEADEVGVELEALRQDVAARTADTGGGDAESRAEADADRESAAEHGVRPQLVAIDGDAHDAPDALSGEERADASTAPAGIELPAAVSPVLTVVTPVEPPAPVMAAAAAAAPAPSSVDVLPAVLAAPVDPLAGIRDEVEADVLPIFLEEAADLFPQAGEGLRAWRRTPAATEHAQELRRTLHTFKGSARMAGAMRLGELAHLMESRLVDGESPAAATPALFEALDTDLDNIAFVLDRLREGEVNTSLPWVAEAEAAAAAARAEGEAEGGPAYEVPPPDAVAPTAVATPAGGPAPAAPASSTAAPLAATLAPPEHAAEAGAHAMLRVRADTVDKLVNEAGEVAIARARVEGELRTLKANLLELTGSVIRLRTQVREIEIQAESQIQSRMSAYQDKEGFDPLEFDRYTRFQELTRSLAEGVNDVSTVQQSLLKNLDDADAALVAQARLSREVQQKLFAIRTVPFGSVSERLYRILRATARELDKRANLEISGAQVELDRSVLEKLVGPLEHLLRNALDHGLESRAARRAAGKSETGEITLTVRQQGNEVVIALKDDGAGIDLAKVRQRATALGMVAADATPTDAQLMECLFKPGFSTASKVTQISGRGIGMDVVRNEINALGGRVDVASTPGKGSTFTLYLPLTLAIAQAVLVRAGGRLWALPAPMVEQVQQVKAEQLVNLYVERKVAWQGVDYPFHYLPRLLGDATHNPETLRYNPVLLVKSGTSVAAIHVDEMVGNQEIVVKNIGPQLARVSGISGATVLGNGEIVLILNPVQLAQRADVIVEEHDTERVVASSTDSAGAPLRMSRPQGGTLPLVLIVDDSLTVRKITSRLLQREGFAVATAKDGIDALDRVAEERPDVILLDIEMPRMDGFEFAKTLKADAANAHIPIIMITSRTAEKHRSRARELGVDLYLGKPYQEDELLKHLREMLDIAVIR
ncbi:MAG: Hpt domain-containing protein [Proteobacteria bacterium]|nr:Hpt domain-containing protein [Pseudomonadota bacterium]